MTEAELAAIEERMNEAGTMPQSNDVTWIWKACIDMTALIAEVRRLQEIIQEHGPTLYFTELE